MTSRIVDANKAFLRHPNAILAEEFIHLTFSPYV